MINFILLLFVVGTLCFYAGLIWFGFRLLDVLKLFANRSSSSNISSSNLGPAPVSHFKDSVVRSDSDDNPMELPPEIIAPSLRKPPRSPGGFGSKTK